MKNFKNIKSASIALLFMGFISMGLGIFFVVQSQSTGKIFSEGDWSMSSVFKRLDITEKADLKTPNEQSLSFALAHTNKSCQDSIALWKYIALPYIAIGVWSLFLGCDLLRKVNNSKKALPKSLTPSSAASCPP